MTVKVLCMSLLLLAAITLHNVRVCYDKLMSHRQVGFGIIGLVISVVLIGIGILIGLQVPLALQHKGTITTLLSNLHGPSTALTATVTGTVTEGPTTPVCMVGRPCDQPVANHTLEAIDASGKIAAQTTTATDGSYTLKLAPGNYTLVLVPKLGMSVNGSQLTAVSGAQTHNIAVDSGLR